MADPTLYFKQIQIGPMQNFAYLIGDSTTREALVVDAAWDIPAIAVKLPNKRKLHDQQSAPDSLSPGSFRWRFSGL